MNVHFATCERNRALGYLQKVYPTRDIADSDECAGPLLDLVEKDILRVQDPMMHGNRIAIIPGKNWSESTEARADATQICQDFVSAATMEAKP